jgi:hypothetical protein
MTDRSMAGKVDYTCVREAAGGVSAPTTPMTDPDAMFICIKHTHSLYSPFYVWNIYGPYTFFLGL